MSYVSSMETPTHEPPSEDCYSTVDASRPFQSVKEAVAIFGERVLRREIHSSLEPPTDSNKIAIAPPSPQFTLEIQSGLAVKNDTSGSTNASFEPPTPSPEITSNEYKFYPSSSFSIASSSVNEPTPSPTIVKHDNNNSGKIMHGNDLVMMLMILKRLEGELQETKMEVKLLKERESETEVALASLNAELHRNMSNIAKVEASEAAKAAMRSKSNFEEVNEERRRCEVMVKSVDSPTLAQILKITDYDSYFGESKRVKKSMKKKPIIPLVTDLFPWKKKATLLS